MLAWTDSSLAAAMRQLMDDLSVWRWLHCPLSQWRGHGFSGDARAVSVRLTLDLGRHPSGFRWMHVHRIATGGVWGHGHNHEWPFCSCIVQNLYHSRSWLQNPFGEQRADSTQECGPGTLVPISEPDRFHSLMTPGWDPALTIVLAGNPFPRERGIQDPTLPTVQFGNLSDRAVREVLSEMQGAYMRMRLRNRAKS